MTCSNLNAQNWIRIILQFVGGNVGESAVGSKVLPSVVLVHYRPANGVLYARCCSILENHLWQPKQSCFSMVRDTVYCQWEVAEGVLGSIGGTSAGRLKFLNFDCLPEN
jgi:hypothetical protein